MKHWLKQSPEHPLRKSLKKDDWNRIEQVMRNELDYTQASVEELDAAYDVLFDAVAAKEQTHLGVLSMQ